MKILSSDSVVTYEHLSVPGVQYRTGRGDVRAFFYPDTLAAQLDYARLDTNTAAPPGVVAKWPAPVTVVRSLNLIAILLFNSPGHTERVANGILGGLPPKSPDQ
jgi:hypothetical protein